ncbi:MAG: hypothetical protein M3496_11615, partial [Pseudomonadota bacterium]|nr:hypothetical protein [Pseudomonadota bacterium]
VDNLPAPIPMRAGDSWASNLIVPAPPGGLAGPLRLRTALEVATDRELLIRSLTGHRGGHRTPNDRWLQRPGMSR